MSNELEVGARLTQTDNWSADTSLETVNIISPQVNRAIEVAIFGDTHNKHQTILNIPKCDLVIHVGDFTDIGTMPEILAFIDWIKRAYVDIPIIVVDGNHERLKRPPYVKTHYDPLKATCSQERKERVFGNSGIYYLSTGQSIKLFGLTITGVPWENEGDIAYRAMNLPSETNIIVAHCPPKGILDKVGESYDHAGSAALGIKVQELPDLTACFFGHAHLARGMK